MIEALTPAAAVVVITGLVEALKMAGLPSQFAALASVAIGVLTSVFVLPEPSLAISMFYGVGYGLAASGLYSGTFKPILSK